MAVWPNGLRTPPKFSSLWKEYDGVPDSTHWGLDSYGYKYNCAIDDAEVIYIGWNTYGGGGREIWYRLGNGDVIVYYHNAVDVLVASGDRIVEGQRLGLQSDTGKTFGVHNHTEVWLRGRRDSRVNPLAYIKALVGASPAGDGGTTILDQEEEEEDMSRNSGFFYTRADKKVVVLICNTDSGFEHEYSNGTSANGEYNGPVAGTFATGSFAPITESHAIALKRALKQVRESSSVNIESITAKIDSKEIAANVEAGLLDNFEALPEAVNDEAARRLAD